MKKRILIIGVLVLSIAMLATGAFAYFTSTAGASGTITSGTLDLGIASVSPSAACPAYGGVNLKSVSLWNSTNFAPGEVLTAKICMANMGNVSMPQVGFAWTGFTGPITNHIFVTHLINSMTGDQIGDYLAAYDSNHDGFMSLAELQAGASGEQEFWVFWGGVPEFLPVGIAVQWVEYTLLFDPLAGNDLQTQTFNYNLLITGYQHVKY
jgi:predicted ribosomally synthesized peptide with SipW-like signal peptide